jgi:hypothetical protein
MTIGGSIALIVLGAILAFAVEFDVGGINIDAIGYILMIGGLIGTFAGLKVVKYHHTHPNNRIDRWLLGVTFVAKLYEDCVWSARYDVDAWREDWLARDERRREESPWAREHAAPARA